MDSSTRLRAALDAAEGLAPADVDSIGVLIKAGEWKLALETLCTQIHEYDVELDGELRGELRELGDELETPVAYLLGDPWASGPDNLA